MTRASTRSEPKRHVGTDPRLAAAGSSALEAYARVRRVADRLGEELDEIPSIGIPTAELDPEDSMVIAVERVIATAKGR